MLPDQMAKNQERQIQAIRERMRRHCSAPGVWTEESLSGHQTLVAAQLVPRSRTRQECKMRLLKAGQSCLAVTQDASSDWKQDTLPSVAHNQSWRGPPIETAKLRKTQTTELQEEAEEGAVEEVVVDADVGGAVEAVVTQPDLLAKAILRLLDNEKRHADQIVGKGELEKWPELASLVSVLEGYDCISSTRKGNATSTHIAMRHRQPTARYTVIMSYDSITRKQ